jgi:hypothetical protein
MLVAMHRLLVSPAEVYLVASDGTFSSFGTQRFAVFPAHSPEMRVLVNLNTILSEVERSSPERKFSFHIVALKSTTFYGTVINCAESAFYNSR